MLCTIGLWRPLGSQQNIHISGTQLNIPKSKGTMNKVCHDKYKHRCSRPLCDNSQAILFKIKIANKCISSHRIHHFPGFQQPPADTATWKEDMSVDKVLDIYWPKEYTNISWVIQLSACSSQRMTYLVETGYKH